ncbi:MAG: hypothetical protein LQ337_006208 [Flavoplaca oasis]|nr:MAG: hypothetical protein LQ337_006208 [Flavoplaca oasis]
MADTACDRLTGLPAELRQTIADSIPREALKNLRVVSKCWNEVATPIIFSEFTYRIHTTPAEWASRIKFERGALVKKLNLTTIEFEAWDRESYEDRLTHSARRAEPEHRHKYLRKAYAAYQKIRRDHLELLRKRDCLDNLASLLESMTNIVEVKLTGDCRAIHEFYPYSKEYNHCKLLGCNPDPPVDKFRNHKCLNVSPRAGLFDMGTTHLQILLSAVARVKSPFSELRIENLSGGGIPYHTLDIPPTVNNLAVFSRLAKLYLVFDDGMPSLPSKAAVAEQYISCVAQTLSYASNLRHLNLDLQDLYYDTYVEPDYVLHGCKLPELLTCELSYSSAKDAPLASFIRGCPKLSHLTIQDRGDGFRDDSTNDEDFNLVLNRTRDALMKERPQLTLEIKKGR